MMKKLFDKLRGKIFNQNGVDLIVAGYNEGHIIGSTTLEIKDRTWTELDDSCHVDDAYSEMNFIYINEELLRN